MNKAGRVTRKREPRFQPISFTGVCRLHECVAPRLSRPPKEKPMKCKCDACKHGDKFYKIIKGLSKNEQKWMSDFYSFYMNTAEDLEYHKAIMSGHWPSAVEQLTVALGKAERIKAEKEN